MSTAASSFANVDEDQHEPLSPAENRNAWIAFWLMIAAMTYGYLNMLIYTASYWSEDLYSHGWIVPLFAGYLLWVRRKPIQRVEARERWIGVGMIAAGLGLRLFGSYYDMDPLDRISFIVCLVGICQLIGGYSMMKWAGLAVAFVVFMFPLPAQLQYTVLTGLQKVAAVCSTFVLQMLGVPALRDGSRIMIDQLPLEVADACSGLRMSTIFLAMCVAMAMLVERPWWDRCIILLSAIPIALVTNIIRITVTALLFMWFGMENKTIEYVIHDYAGLAMMPIALGLLGLELKILTNLTLPIETDDYSGFGAGAAAT
ncbi:MAG: exosortase/archaeosortase family protein [Planctomycetota bacterium]